MRLYGDNLPFMQVASSHYLQPAYAEVGQLQERDNSFSQVSVLRCPLGVAQIAQIGALKPEPQNPVKFRIISLCGSSLKGNSTINTNGHYQVPHLTYNDDP